MDVSELAAMLKEPVEVWMAVEGDSSKLIALLRSDKELTKHTRDALADWLEGRLQPAKLPKGRPRTVDSDYLSIWGGHDVLTRIGMAGYDYDRFRRFIRKKGWHLKKAGKMYRSSEWLMEKIAERAHIDIQKFNNYVNRPMPKRQRSQSKRSDFATWMRWQIAREIHHAKKRGKG